MQSGFTSTSTTTVSATTSSTHTELASVPSVDMVAVNLAGMGIKKIRTAGDAQPEHLETKQLDTNVPAARSSTATAPPPRSLPEKLKHFCQTRDIKSTGTLAITIQKNRSTNFSSIICDFDTMTVESHYPIPAAVTDNYQEQRVRDYNVAYRADLDSSVFLDMRAKSTSTTVAKSAFPFCCSAGLREYRGKYIQKQGYFTDFLAGRGTRRDVVYEVKAQVDNGPMISTKFYKLVDGVQQEVQGNFEQKVHAFKNYKCARHNRFYAVDLYRVTHTAGYNHHHMRVNPCTRINKAFMEQFFDDVLFS